MTCFRYLLTNTLFLTGQWSSFVMFAISFPLSLFSLPQSYNRCYIRTLLYCTGEAVQLYPGHVVEPSFLLVLWLFRVMAVKWTVVTSILEEILSLKMQTAGYCEMLEAGCHNLDAHNIIAVKTSNFTYTAYSLPFSFC